MIIPLPKNFTHATPPITSPFPRERRKQHEQIIKETNNQPASQPAKTPTRKTKAWHPSTRANSCALLLLPTRHLHLLLLPLLKSVWSFNATREMVESEKKSKQRWKSQDPLPYYECPKERDGIGKTWMYRLFLALSAWHRNSTTSFLFNANNVARSTPAKRSRNRGEICTKPYIQTST